MQVNVCNYIVIIVFFELWYFLPTPRLPKHQHQILIKQEKGNFKDGSMNYYYNIYAFVVLSNNEDLTIVNEGLMRAWKCLDI